MTNMWHYVWWKVNNQWDCYRSSVLYIQGASAKTWRYIKMLIEQKLISEKWSSLLLLQWQLLLTKTKLKIKTF